VPRELRFLFVDSGRATAQDNTMTGYERTALRLRAARILICAVLAVPAVTLAYGPMYNIGNLGTLDSSWYYQAIQYRIVENARERNQGGGRSAPAASASHARLVTTAEGTSAVPARLASGYPAQGRKQAASTFASLLRSYADIERRFNIPAGDLGGAAAAFVAGCWMALHASDFPDPHFDALVRQMRAVMATEPGVDRSSAREKREAYEQLAIIGMFMATTQMGLKAQPNAELTQRSREAARAYLQQFFKGDVDRLALTESGLVLR
jgi:hypothetical protein